MSGLRRISDVTREAAARLASGERAVIALVLIASIAVAGVLGYQAFAADRANVETASHALEQYSSVAVWQFSRSAQREMQIAADRTIGMRVQHAMRMTSRGPGELLTPAQLRDAMADCDCKPAPLPVQQFFRWDVGRADVLAEEGLSARDRSALAARLSADVSLARWPHAECDLLLDRDADGAARMLAVAAVYDDARRVTAVYGAIVAIREAEVVFGRAARRESLLPTALLPAAAQDSVIAISVETGGLTVFSRGPTGSARFVAVDSLGGATFSSVVRAGLAPVAVDRLLIGGLPRSRLPLIGVFMTLSLILLVVALGQMRRAFQLATLRADFVSSVSHELRTPLSLVKVYAETLIDDDTVDRAQRGKFLGVILKETNRLGRLVENLLRVAELDRRSLTVSPVPTNLSETLGAAVADFRPLADSRSVELESNVGHAVIAVVDPGALRQIVFNLLTNAVKFGHEGTRVAVTLERDGDRAQILVDDDGPGIPAAQRGRVFNRYVRLTPVASGAPAGSGIGLAVVRELAHAQRMSVWIDDSPLGGTRVVLSIPLADARGVADVSLATMAEAVGDA